MVRLILVTGSPGVGKTTLICRLVDRLQKRPRHDHQGRLRLSGFYTEQVTDAATGKRCGFDAVSLSLKSLQGPLARLQSSVDAHDTTGNQKHRPHVGRYRVHVHEFERFLCESKFEDANCDLLVLDEIGRMELLSGRFVGLIESSVLGRPPTACIIATVPLRGGGKLVDQLKSSADAKLYTITERNRDETFDEIAEELKYL